MIGGTSNSPAKVITILQGAPIIAESFGAKLGNEEHDLTMTEQDCVLSSADEDVRVLSAFATERLQCLSERRVEKFIGDQSVNVKKILCGSIGVGEDSADKIKFVCPNWMRGGDFDENDRMLSWGEEINQITEKSWQCEHHFDSEKGARPINTKRRGSALSEQDEPPCKAVIFDVASGGGTAGGGQLPRGNATNASEVEPQSFVTNGGISTLSGTARSQADQKVMGARIDKWEEGMVRIPPVDKLFAQEAIPKVRTKYYPCQSAKTLLKDISELNPLAHLDHSHPTTSFRADQMIQLARALGFEVSFASYSMLEDLLLMERRRRGAYPVTPR